MTSMQEISPHYLPAGVNVWRLELDFQNSRLDELLQQLPAEEQARCLRYRQPADRCRFAATRVALRQLLAERLHIPVQEVALRIDAFGKPRLANDEKLFFNLSHSGNHALIALSAEQPVGVDIEAAGGAATAPLADAALTLEERRYCTRQPDKAAAAQAFFRIWSGKEAVLKALGLGIASHLQSVSVVPGLAGRYAVTLDMPAPPLQAWQLPAPAGFVAALAVLD
ncbi:4'-phosphopantetheinyl transferase superfamily protein [soil metagenome]